LFVLDNCLYICINIKTNKTMDKSIKIKLSDDLQVMVVPNQDHEFLMTTKEVALAYGISPETLRRHKQNHSDELYEGKHFVSAVQILNAEWKSGNYEKPNTFKQTLWSKRGIVRLGFFINSERARMVRDWAEDLMIEQLEGGNTKQIIKELPNTPKRKHNRLTVDRINDIMHYVCMIDDRSLRMIIAEKLKSQ
jgi:hypothetical protein